MATSTRTHRNHLLRTAVAALSLVAAVGMSACEKVPTDPLSSYRSLKGSSSTVRWYMAPSASEPGKTLYYGIESSAASNRGPIVLIVPGGGGQAGEWYLRQARVYAQAGYRPYVACIATTAGMFVPAGPVTCPNTPKSHAADLAAGRDVVNLVNAIRGKHPSVRSNARQLILVGDSYGGAAVLHASALGGWGHPVVTVNGTNTWMSPTPPNVPSGDTDPALPTMLQRINAPVVQFAGGQDDLVPAGVASSALHAARSQGVTTSKIVLTGSDHIEPLGGATNADARCANEVIVDAMDRLADGQTVVSTTTC